MAGNSVSALWQRKRNVSSVMSSQRFAVGLQDAMGAGDKFSIVDICLIEMLLTFHDIHMLWHLRAFGVLLGALKSWRSWLASHVRALRSRAFALGSHMALQMQLNLTLVHRGTEVCRRNRTADALYLLLRRLFVVLVVDANALKLLLLCQQ